jgi:glycosyltransferase involved in cell wall biosynthesis
MAQTRQTLENVTVVAPAYNEAASVGAVVEGARAATPGLVEVLVIDDGSTDGTAEVAARAGARVVRLSPNQGKGHAVRTAIREARGDVLVFIDADGQDDPAEIPRLLDALTPDVAMVIGSRFRGTLREGAITRLNHAGNRSLTWLFNRLFRSSLTDTQAGFRAVRKSAIQLDLLRASRYEIETELTLHVLQQGSRVVEVPVSRDRRTGGSSGFVVPYHGLRILSWMVAGRLRARRAPSGGR